MAEPARPFDGDRLLTVHEVMAKVGLRRTALYRRIEQGTFPAPLKLSESCVRWRLSAVEKWIDDLPSARSSAA